MTNELSSELDLRFRIHVERIVRPVRAAERRKDRMREELLAHATAAFLEERDKHNSDCGAAVAAFDRLGESSELTRELQAGVPWVERALFTGQKPPAQIKRWLMRKPDEPSWRYAVRCTAMYGLLFPVGILALGLLVAFARSDASVTDRITHIWPILVGLWLYILTFGCISLANREVIHRAIWGPARHFISVVGICLFEFVWVLSMVLWIRWEAIGRVIVIGPDLWLWFAFAALAPAILILSSRLGHLERQRFYRWTSLNLAQ